ncbi:MAG: hypothetical protein WBI07_15820 [Mobilitalea sp.]
MLGVIILVLVLGVEVGVMIGCLKTSSYQKKLRNKVNIGLFLFLVLLVPIGIIHWSFRWYLLFLFLFLRALVGTWYFVRKSRKNEAIFKKKYVIMLSIRSILLLLLVAFPMMLFPQFRVITATGSKDVKTVSYTLTDLDRMETYTDIGENRKITIQFWYPESTKEKYPLLIFSHGAFGFRGSNASTYEELASNGYVVCSIDHTYHSFFTKQTDGKVVIVNTDFLSDAVAVQNNTLDEQETYELLQEWLKIRMADVNLTMKEITKNVESGEADEVYTLINLDKIGLFGHSMGGATAAKLGRERSDIDAVIVIDGTMFGEDVGFEDGKAMITKEPYPIPILNMYNEEHYRDALAYAESYENIIATENAVDARQIVVNGSGHLNFTDLPMFSPALAGLLGTGKVDSRYCIETMNRIILDYFNYYLKDAEELNLKTTY